MQPYLLLDRVDSDSDGSVDVGPGAAASSSDRFQTVAVDVQQRPGRAERTRLDNVAVQQVLSRVVSQDGSVAALPLFYEDPRTTARSRAGSVLRANVNRWLESDEGKAWMTSKKKMLDSKLNDGPLSGSSGDEVA